MGRVPVTGRTEGTLENTVFRLSVTLDLVAVVDSIIGTDVVTSENEKSKNKCCTKVKRAKRKPSADLL